jgi:Arc/MetJ-type ribon-helix-helix transcriptional regulator
MNVPLKPELQRFIDDLVKAGRFTSSAEAVEAGIARLMLDPSPDVADARDVADLRESLEQVRRGETVDAESLHGALRRKHLDR